jgi:hypothetical protein
MRAFAVPLALCGPLLCLLLLPPASPSVAPAEAAVAVAAPEGPQEALVDRVKKSIEDGVTYLRRAEDGNGCWDRAEDLAQNRPTGKSSLVLLALLNAGVPPDDPAVRRGLAYLRKHEPKQTYEAALHTMVYVLAGQEQDRPRVRRNAEWLVEAHGPSGWGYTMEGRAGGGDGSNTQYALLGLHEARQAGIPVNDKVLRAVRDYYLKTQSRGAWRYKEGSDERNNPYSMTMTTAGLCGLLITGLDLDVNKQELNLETGVAKNCGAYDEDQRVAGALAWIGARFPSRLTPEVAREWDSPYYCLYGIERAGRLSGQRFLGGQDWYRVGCEYLVSTQRRDGSWQGGGNRNLDAHPVIATSFSLLFLSRGRTPVLITKMARTSTNPQDPEDWNRKHNDLRHLVDFASRELFKGQPLAWQNFDVRKLEAGNDEDNRRLAAELLPSPVVWLSGHQCELSAREEAILREYLNNGGFVFAEACCGSKEYDDGFRKLVTRLFADSKAELVQLPPDHPVWTASGKWVSSPKDFELWGVQQGCKTVLVYSPKPVAGYWEANALNDPHGRKAFELGANVIAYGTGLEAPRPRLTEVKLAPPQATKETVKRGYLEVVELAHDGDWMWPAKAVPNLMQELRADGLDVARRPALAQLSAGTKASERPDALIPEATAPVRDVRDGSFFFLHGRRSFAWDAKAKEGSALEGLRFKLAEGGATLLADAACGSDDFDDGFRKFIDALFEGKHKLVPIPLEDELYSKELNGAAIATVKCRRKDGRRVNPQPLTVAPELEGVKIDGRWVVIYSRYDIGCALEKHGSSNCLEHDYDSAVRLARAAVLYHLRR